MFTLMFFYSWLTNSIFWRILVSKQFWLLCVSWLNASCYGTGVSFWMRCERVNGAGSFSAIKILKPYVLVCSSHKDLVWLQKTSNATRLVCNVLYSSFMVSFCNKYLWLHLYLPVCVLYCSEVGRFRVRVGLGAPMKVKMYIKWLIFLQMHANH